MRPWLPGSLIHRPWSRRGLAGYGSAGWELWGERLGREDLASLSELLLWTVRASIHIVPTQGRLVQVVSGTNINSEGELADIPE